eukprot:jgi/Psemu1/42868/gm1.42868_g
MPEGTQSEENNTEPTTRGITPDTSLDTSHITGTRKLRDLRDQLEELELYNWDMLEYTGERQNQLQQQNKLLYDYTEQDDSEGSNKDSTDNEMVKRKDYTGVKDHLDDTQLKPILIPISVDVYEFKKTLANALAEVVSIKYLQGSGYAFLLESEEQYNARDASAQYPTAPIEPQELDSSIELTSDMYKLWKRRHALYVEWNKYDREALLITDKNIKFLS